MVLGTDRNQPLLSLAWCRKSCLRQPHWLSSEGRWFKATLRRSVMHLTKQWVERRPTPARARAPCGDGDKGTGSPPSRHGHPRNNQSGRQGCRDAASTPSTRPVVEYRVTIHPTNDAQTCKRYGSRGHHGGPGFHLQHPQGSLATSGVGSHQILRRTVPRLIL